MKGVILSGGLGTRLRPLTHTGAKQLIPIANKPVLEYCIEDLKETGITEIAIIVGYTPERVQSVKDTIGDGSGGMFVSLTLNRTLPVELPMRFTVQKISLEMMILLHILEITFFGIRSHQLFRSFIVITLMPGYFSLKNRIHAPMVLQ